MFSRFFTDVLDTQAELRASIDTFTNDSHREKKNINGVQINLAQRTTATSENYN